MWRQSAFCTSLGPGVYVELKASIRAAGIPHHTGERFFRLLCHDSSTELSFWTNYLARAGCCTVTYDADRSIAFYRSHAMLWLRPWSTIFRAFNSSIVAAPPCLASDNCNAFPDTLYFRFATRPPLMTMLRLPSGSKLYCPACPEIQSRHSHWPTMSVAGELSCPASAEKGARET